MTFKNKKFLFLLSLGFILPSMTSCSTPSFVEKLYISGKDKIEIGETTSFKTEIYPTPKSEQVISWSTSDSNVVYVDQSGNVTGVNKGKASIIAKAGNVETRYDVFIGGFIENSVTNITLEAIPELKVGDYKLITSKIIPENATNKELTWSSSNSQIASVNENGVVKAEFKGEATITAISKENNKVVATMPVTVSERDLPEKLSIKSFSKPSCLLHYEEKIAHLEDKIDQTKINRDNSKKYITNNFFKYDKGEEEKQIYKVGTDNPFRFKCNITTTTADDPFKEIHDNNPYQTFELYKKNGTEYGENIASQYASYKGNEIQFKKEDAGNIFKLVVKPNKDKYNGIEDSMTATIEFKVIDGYNAYDFAGLTTIDNWTTSVAKATIIESAGKEILNKGEFVDLWSKYKEEHDIPIPSWGHNSVILHNNILIKQDELPSNITWTEKETDDFIFGQKFEYSQSLFDYFVETKSAMHDDDWGNLPQNVKKAKCRYLLNGSRKDHTAIFSRQMNNNFTFEGNYFTIDESKVKPICYFDDVSLKRYNTLTIHYSSLFSFGISNMQLYNKCDRSLNPLFDEFRPYGELQCRNSNEVFISNLNIIGNATKNGIHDEGIGGDCSFTTNCVDSTFTNVNSFSCCRSFIHSGEAGVINTRMTLDRCKVSDNFSEFMYLKSASNTQVNNCIMRDAASVAIRMYEEENAGNIRPSNLHLNNSYIECFVSGNEVYNKNVGYGYIIKILGSIGYDCFKQYNDVKYGKNGKFAPKMPRNFIKVEDDTIYINFIVLHSYGNLLNFINPGKSSMDVDGKAIFNLENDASAESPISKYNDLIHGTFGAISFKSSESGHARLPLGKIVEPNDLEMYDSNISLFSGHMISLSEYCSKKDEIDNDENIGSVVPCNFGNLFSGDYLTCYLKPPVAYMNAFVLGYK